MNAATLHAQLAAVLSTESLAWLDAQLARVATGDERMLDLAVGQCARRVGREPLTDPTWSTDQAARVLLLLALPAADPDPWLATLDRLFHAGTVEELVAFYRALPLLPYPERLRARAAEGVRSNMRPVFEAVALDSPYPAAQLDGGAWNQLVLKAFFLGAEVSRITGLERRCNPELGRMLADYARERRAAQRSLDPRLPPLARLCGADCPD